MNERSTPGGREDRPRVQPRESQTYRYEKVSDPQWLERIEQEIKTSKTVTFEFEGKSLKMEYIEVPAKDSPEEKEGEHKEKVIVLIPGFAASHVPYAPPVRELAQYLPGYRVICLSPFDSGKSSALKGSSLEKMNRAYHEAFKQMGIDSEHSKATIIGHSRSDIIALGLASAYPDLVKQIVLINGVSANPSGLPKLAYQFTRHTIASITPERIKRAFKDEYGRDERDVAENYWRQTIDFMKNMLQFPQVVHQLNSLRQRQNVDLRSLLSSLASDVLILSGTADLTAYEDTSERIYMSLPDNVRAEHSIEVGGLHDELSAHPEGVALKVAHWLSSLRKK
ncbi:alpha/beta hydrolase [Candidatus Uhrbacteria bacterium]|nr:alpha/beta hydrolase [Candidatus Uhrbacteria bacterium]